MPKSALSVICLNKRGLAIVATALFRQAHLAIFGLSEAVMKAEVLGIISRCHLALRRENVLRDNQRGFRLQIPMLTCPRKESQVQSLAPCD